jgi:hypothetical protein
LDEKAATQGISMMDHQSSNASLASHQMGRLHRHFHGRWSGMRLIVGALVNLSGLMGLGWIVLGG